MPGARMRRVNEAVREVLSAHLEDLKDPRVGFTTVTAVDVSPDLRRARVFVSVLGDDAERESTLAGLRSSHGFLQALLAEELRLKHTPTLDFLYDESLERAMRIQELLSREAPEGGHAATAQPSSRPGPGADPGAGAGDSADSQAGEGPGGEEPGEERGR